MSEVGRNQEIPSPERMSSEINGFRDIKPEDGITFKESQKYWDSFFDSDIEEDDYFSTYDESFLYDLNRD